MEPCDPNMQTASKEEMDRLFSAEEERHAEIDDDPKKKKFIALFQARTVLSKIGNMAERRMSKTQLKRMKKLGINSV